MELFLWLHACESTRKVMSQTSRERALFRKERATNVPVTKLELSTVLPACSWNCKQVKGRVLAKRIDVYTEHIKHSDSRDSFLRCMKENDPKKKKERCQVQLRHQPAPPRAAHCKSRWRGACAVGKPFPVHSRHEACNKVKDL